MKRKQISGGASVWKMELMMVSTRFNCARRVKMLDKKSININWKVNRSTLFPVLHRVNKERKGKVSQGELVPLPKPSI